MFVRCHHCGIPFYIKKFRLNRLKNGKISCSRECAAKLKQQIYNGDKNPNFKYEKNLNFIYNMSHDGVYILGLIWADGTIHKNTIQLSQNESESRNLLSSISYKIFGFDNTKQKNKNLSTLEITDKTLVDFIINLGGIKKGKKSNCIEFPKIPVEKNWSFICGYFDGDGGFKYNYKYPEISITSNSPKMLIETAKYWNVNYKSGDKIYASGYKALDICDKMYKNVSFHHSKKYDYFIDILNWEPLSNGSWLKDIYFKYKKLSKEAITPTKERATDIGYDIYGIEVEYKEDCDLYVLDTKIAIQPIPGYYFDVVGRSSLPKSGFIFAGGVGIIDPGYVGSIKMYLKKIRKNAEITLPFKAGQLILRKALHVIPIEVDELQMTDRGNKGFGSSDKNGGKVI